MDGWEHVCIFVLISWVAQFSIPKTLSREFSNTQESGKNCQWASAYPQPGCYSWHFATFALSYIPPLPPYFPSSTNPLCFFVTLPCKLQTWIHCSPKPILFHSLNYSSCFVTTGLILSLISLPLTASKSTQTRESDFIASDHIHHNMASGWSHPRDLSRRLS